eukprot:564476-Hanusia_phi.AAC.4
MGQGAKELDVEANPPHLVSRPVEPSEVEKLRTRLRTASFGEEPPPARPNLPAANMNTTKATAREGAREVRRKMRKEEAAAREGGARVKRLEEMVVKNEETRLGGESRKSKGVKIR